MMIRKSNSSRKTWRVETYQDGFDWKVKAFHCGVWAFHDPPTAEEEKKGRSGIYQCRICQKIIQANLTKKYKEE